MNKIKLKEQQKWYAFKISEKKILRLFIFCKSFIASNTYHAM